MLPETKPAPAAHIRLVLADDHPAVRAGIRQFLERDPGLEVVAEANNGDEAISLIAAHQPDVAVLDLQMPGLSGLDVARRLRSEQPKVRVLILTAHDDDPYIFAALRSGAKGYMLKTSGPDELIRAVRLVHSGRSALDPSVAERVVEQMGQSGDQTATGLTRPSDRELEVLKLAAHGLTNRAIGAQLNISERTVHSHLMNVFSKMGTGTRTEAVLKAIHMGWLSLEDTTD